MQSNLFEAVIGFVVLAVAAGFLFVAYQSSGMNPQAGYSVEALFENAEGLSVGSDVRIGGIKVGVVNGLSLDVKTYQAKVSLNLYSDVEIPADSSAAIVSEGLLGGKYVALSPGGDEQLLAEGDKIEFTQSSVNLESLLGKWVFSGGGVEKDTATGSEGANPPAAADTPKESLVPTLDLE
jgi:phospholipid/cholesterol/gamma-HCH transport system substrate-binding protein